MIKINPLTNAPKRQSANALTYAFIDSQNLNLSIRDQGWTLDFKKFYVYLQDKHKVKRAFLFIGHIPGNEMLYTQLQKYGYILVFKPTLEIKKGDKTTVKGNVDAELVLHSMIEYPNYKQAIIVSGDGDFHCLIEYLDQQKKLYKIIIPNKLKYSALLRKFRNYFVFLTDLKQKLQYQKKRGSNLRTKP